MPKRNMGKSFEQIRAEVTQLVNDIPTIAGVEAVRHFKNTFRDQGFTDASLKKWPARKNNTDPGRAIMIKTGRTRRAVKVLRKIQMGVVVGIDRDEVPYAEPHNSGGTFRVKAHRRRNRRNDVFSISSRRKSASGISLVSSHTRIVGRRQMIGKSVVLDKNIEHKVVNRLKRIHQ